MTHREPLRAVLVLSGFLLGSVAGPVPLGSARADSAHAEGVSNGAGLAAPAAPTSEPQQGLAELLVLAGRDAARLEGLRYRVTCNVLAHLEKLDGKGAVDNRTEIQLHVVGDGKQLDSRIVRVVEDGEDKTAEARKKQAEEKAKAAKEKNKKRYELTLPFLPSEQSKYVFALAETDPSDPNRVRVTFTPKVKGENVYAGEAWLDKRQGTLLTMGFRPTKLPSFLFWMNVKLVFGAQTSAGPSLSQAWAEGEGGFLFIRKRFRMDATIGDYTIQP